MNNKETYNLAKSYLGQGGAIFRKYCGLPSGAAWCNAFVTYIFAKSGNANLYCGGKKQTYCPTSIKLCRKDMAEIPMYLAMPMDVIYFDWDRNGVPNHIGFVRNHVSCDTINTIEGNTSNKVMNKTRPAKYVCGIYRPHYKPNVTLTKGKLSVDGDFGYKSIYMLQVVLGGLTCDGILGKATVKRLQHYLALTEDGAWGTKTSKAVQKLVGAKQDGAFGLASVKALQTWINKKYTPAPQPTPKPTPTPTPKPTLKSYRIEVDLTNQICTVYGIYSDGSKKGIMSEWVSTAKKGKTTPTGNFKIQGASGGRKAKARTALMSGGKTYAEFLCRFHGGKCMHTVPYKSRQTTGHVNKTEFNKLGSVASAGCVRMPWKLAHYIYTTCPIGTPVIVFKGTKDHYPMGKPTKYHATTDIDPTYKK